MNSQRVSVFRSFPLWKGVEADRANFVSQAYPNGSEHVELVVEPSCLMHTGYSEGHLEGTHAHAERKGVQVNLAWSFLSR